MPDQDKIPWAGKVSRRDIQRLYESDAQNLLDEDLLEQVASIPQPFWMGGRNKDNVL